MSTDVKSFAACRSCLAVYPNMRNMYETGLNEDFFMLSGLTEERCVTDLLCKSCEDIILNCRRFKTQSLNSHQQLKQWQESLYQSTQLTNTKISRQVDSQKVTYIIETCDTEEKILIPCLCCDVQLEKREFCRHFEKHNMTQPLEIVYQCSICTKKFDNRKKMNQHLFKVHTVKNFICKNCKETFSREADLIRHQNICDMQFFCGICNIKYKRNESLLVHLMRKHPDLHVQYKNERKINKKELSKKKSKLEEILDVKKPKLDDLLDSPKRSCHTQTIINDISLSSAVTHSETQTKGLNMDCFDIDSKIDSKNTDSKSPSIKVTQTCVCHLDSPRFESTLTSSETQTLNYDDIMNFNSIETQTCFDEF